MDMCFTKMGEQIKTKENILFKKQSILEGEVQLMVTERPRWNLYSGPTETPVPFGAEGQKAPGGSSPRTTVEMI